MTSSTKYIIRGVISAYIGAALVVPIFNVIRWWVPFAVVTLILAFADSFGSFILCAGKEKEES